MNGKKTYMFLAGLVVSLAGGFATRHGIDMGPITPDLTDALATLFAGGAAWARSVAQPAVVVSDQQAKAQTGPQF